MDLPAIPFAQSMSRGVLLGSLGKNRGVGCKEGPTKSRDVVNIAHEVAEKLSKTILSRVLLVWDLPCYRLPPWYPFTICSL